MKNLPKKIYLNVGDMDDYDAVNLDFYDLVEVTWSTEKIDQNDIEFILKAEQHAP